MKNFLISSNLFFGVWLLLNGSLAPEYIITGLMIAFAMGIWSTMKFPVFRNMRLTPKAFAAFFIFSHVFMFELIKSNIDVAIRVLSPKIPIKPGIVEVKTKLTDPVARLLLANAITLTPGTFTLDTEGPVFRIHWIDAGVSAEQSQELVTKFEKYLEVMYA